MSSQAFSQEVRLPEPQPSGFIHLDKQEQKELATFIKQCSLDKKNVETYKRQYDICADKNELSPQWWQTSYGVTGIFILGLVAGALVVK
jgi:hypothetical protein